MYKNQVTKILFPNFNSQNQISMAKIDIFGAQKQSNDTGKKTKDGIGILTRSRVGVKICLHVIG